MSSSQETSLAALLTTGIAYFAAAEIGRTLAIPPGMASAVWPASGVALGCLLRWGRGVWPAILVGSTLSNALHTQAALGVLLGSALLVGLGAALHALAADVILQRLRPEERASRPLQDDLPDLRALALAIFAASVVSPLIGVTSFTLLGVIPSELYAESLLTWWLGDLGGVLIVTPLLIFPLRVEVELATRRDRIELAAIGISCAVVFAVLFKHNPDGPELAYLAQPFLIWAALRFGLRGVAVTAASMSAAALSLFAFWLYHGDADLFWLQSFLAINALSGLTLGAFTSERLRRLHRLEARHAVDNRVIRSTSRALDAERQDRARLDALLEATFANLPLALHLSQPDATILLQNPASIERWGDRVGQPIATLDAPDALVQAFEAHHARALSGEATRNVELSCEAHTLLTSSLPIRRRGEVEGVLTWSLDISERIQAEVQRRDLEEQLLQSQRLESLGLLAGGVAHDFNNILVPILGFAQLIQSALPGESPLQPDVEAIVDAAQQAAQLVDQLLAFGRRQILTLDPLELIAYLRQLTPMLRRTLREDIQLQLHLPEPPLCVEADPTQLSQVLLNLALNAQEAMPSGGHLSITVERADEARASIRVEDDGRGMDEATRAQIFEPFFTTGDRTRRTGLGLSTAYGIMQQHHGAIDCESEPGIGTTFTLSLPLCSSPGARDPLERDDDSPPIPANTPDGPRTILVVEDDDTVRELTARLLRHLGYACLTAGHPREALELAIAADIDLILSDVVMPEMHGPELYEAICRERPGPDLPVIFMSGYSEDAFGGDPPEHLLQKPFTLQALRDALDAQEAPCET